MWKSLISTLSSLYSDPLQLKKTEISEKIYEEVRTLNRKGSDYKELSVEIRDFLHKNASLQNFKMDFDKAYPNFLNELTDKHPKLTSNEQRLCAFIKLGLKSKEIAEITGVSHRAVDKARERLKKKLDPPTGLNVSDYLEKIN